MRKIMGRDAKKKNKITENKRCENNKFKWSERRMRAINWSETHEKKTNTKIKIRNE